MVLTEFKFDFILIEKRYPQCSGLPLNLLHQTCAVLNPTNGGGTNSFMYQLHPTLLNPEIYMKEKVAIRRKLMDTMVKTSC